MRRLLLRYVAGLSAEVERFGQRHETGAISFNTIQEKTFLRVGLLCVQFGNTAGFIGTSPPWRYATFRC